MSIKSNYQRTPNNLIKLLKLWTGKQSRRRLSHKTDFQFALFTALSSNRFYDFIGSAIAQHLIRKRNVREVKINEKKIIIEKLKLEIQQQQQKSLLNSEQPLKTSKIKH